MQDCNCKCSTTIYDVCHNGCCNENLCELDCIIANLKSELFERQQNMRDYCALESKFIQLQNDIKLLSDQKNCLECELCEVGNEGNKLICNLKMENENLKNELNEKNTLNKKTKPLYSITHKNSKGILKSKNDQSNYYLRDLNKAQTFIETIDTKTKKSKDEKLNFIHYLAYLIPFAKYHPYIKIYSDFRIQMISEENLIINNLNIDKLLKKSKDVNNSFNQDLETPRTNLNND